MVFSTACPVPEALRDFLLGKLPENEAEPVGRHLSVCTRCLGFAGQLRDNDALLEAVRAQSAPLGAEEEQVGVLIQRIRGLLTVSGDSGCSIDPSSAFEQDDFLAPPEGRDEIGRLGPYRILGRLGAGGMGIVFHAEEMALRRPVALKVMRPELAAGESARRRFLREAQTAAAIEHDHVVTIFQVGEARGLPYLAMPLYQGETLGARLKRQGRLAPAEVARIGREVAEALAAAHARGLIHRDLKPDNIWLESGRDRVKVLDFGLARSIVEPTDLTQEGTLIGTPAYMAPEQAGGEWLDHRADLFSLGSVLYAMCTGVPPFHGRSNLATVRLVCDQPAAPIAKINPQVPLALIEVIEALHAKDPANRIPTATMAVEQLRRCEEWIAAPTPARSPRLTAQRWAVAASVVLLLALALGWGEARGVSHVARLVSTVFQQSGGPPAGSEVDTTPRGGRQLVQVRPSAPTTPELAHHLEAIPPDQEPAPATVDVIPAVAQEALAYTAAILPFEQRGTDSKQLGLQTSDILFAHLVANPRLVLVDRADLAKTLQELELNASGMVKPSEATRLGQLTGAKILITGSVVQVDKTIYLIAKVIGTETGRVLGASIQGVASDDLGPLVEKVAEKVAALVLQQGGELVPRVVPQRDRIHALKRTLLPGKRPLVQVSISERHVGQATIDPAAETEFTLFCKATGFPVVDPGEGAKGKADLLVTGEGFSEFAGRHGNLVSVKARVEIKAVERKTGRVVAIDRQTSRVVDLSEQVAGKSALQEAAAAIAERMLPKLMER
ncbi:serine/threonine-protein kinase [Singulisphaera sp. Ch08]|uniref:Serine/threonine-protein kinase n=1 Tax=Singulisphaera sp. Ch08 TaxID=3120278 RepID=A0AAU7CHB3_9BACT